MTEKKKKELAEAIKKELQKIAASAQGGKFIS